MTNSRPLPPVAGVIGWPVSHSKSPIIHGFWLKELGLDGHYVRFPVAPDNLAAALRALPALGMRGVNVTLPHKEAVMATLDEIAPEARVIGAVNTVVVDEQGRLTGHNTDAAGFAEPLAGLNLRGQAVCVIGAGGAARAALTALRKLGLHKVRVINRSQERASRLLAGSGIAGYALGLDQADLALAKASLVVNTTSLGMTGMGPLEIDLSGVAEDALVYDVVYTPLETPLLKAARARGLKTIDGLSMLIGQAARAFHLFYGVEPPRDPAREAALRVLLAA